MDINTTDEESNQPTSDDTNNSEYLLNEPTNEPEELLLETEEEEVQEVSFSKYIYSDIIFYPKATFKRLLEVSGSVWVKRRVLLLLFLVCIPQALTSSHGTDKFADMNLYYAVTGYLEYVGIQLAKSVLIGASVNTVILLLFLVVGRKVLDRDVKFREYSTILAWALIPAIFANFGILGIQTIANKIFTAQYYLTHELESTVTTMQIVSVTLVFIKLALWVWSFYLVGYGMYVLHSFHIKEALFNIIIPILFVLALFVIGVYLQPYIFTSPTQ